MTGTATNRRLMLISNSRSHGQGYLEHCSGALKRFLGPINSIVFVPYALKDWDKYTAIAREGFSRMGITVTGIHEVPGKSHSEVIQSAEAVFVGGGNTFRLLDTMYRREVMDAIRARVDAGMPYLGASAGANVACPTIKTTNDMPIVHPLGGFDALNLVSFQINPHFIDADPNSTHMGETRETRIAEFLEENQALVVGLREGSLIEVEHGFAYLKGATGARLFTRNDSTGWLPNVPLKAV